MAKRREMRSLTPVEETPVATDISSINTVEVSVDNSSYVGCTEDEKNEVEEVKKETENPISENESDNEKEDLKTKINSLTLENSRLSNENDVLVLKLSEVSFENAQLKESMKSLEEKYQQLLRSKNVDNPSPKVYNVGINNKQKKDYSYIPRNGYQDWN